MFFCDHNQSIVEWGSEEVIIPYRCPTDGRVHRYYPDFYIKVKSRSGPTNKYLIEVKPKEQTQPPNDKPKRKTASWKRAPNTLRTALSGPQRRTSVRTGR